MHTLGSLIDAPKLEVEIPARRLSQLSTMAKEFAALGVSPAESVFAFFVPGRIEVLGKHTDYAGGRSLTAATNRGMMLIGASRRDRRIRMYDVVRDEETRFDLDVDSSRPAPAWAIYPETVAKRFLKNVNAQMGGADIIFGSDLPAAAGLSSSSVLVVGTYLSLFRSNSRQPDPWIGTQVTSRLLLAGYLGAVENGRQFGSLDGGEGVGTFGGDQDHTAILSSGKDEVRQFSYLPSRLERVLSMPEGFVFAIGVSGVHSSKTSGAKEDYNRTSLLAGELLGIWNQQTGAAAATLAEVLAGESGASERMLQMLEQRKTRRAGNRALANRLRHFRLESEKIVPRAGDALAAGDLGSFGDWVDRSHEQGSRLLANQVEETLWLAARGRELGALAASAFGAGFGGSVWALVPELEVDSFLRRWSAEYLARFPERRASSSFFSTPAAGPATEL